MKLSELTLPVGTEIIEKRAFYKCKELKKVQLPESLLRIGEQAFYFCGIEELELPEGLQELGDKAFFKCNGLRKSLLPQKRAQDRRRRIPRLQPLGVSGDPP